MSQDLFVQLQLKLTSKENFHHSDRCSSLQEVVTFRGQRHFSWITVEYTYQQ